MVSFFLLPKTSWPHRQLSQAREEQDGEGGGQVRQVLVEEPLQLGFVFLALKPLHMSHSQMLGKVEYGLPAKI